ncbi:MAG: permease [Deltaproteobacteria bacterium]|nr:permease [Deltaproteobacteria bacterium]
MDISALLMIALAGLLMIVVYLKSPDSVGRGLNSSFMLIIEIAPRLISAFIIAGLIQEIVPPELIARLMGKESGFKGIVLGTVIGTFTPGGPMTNFPILASLYKTGIGIGPTVSFLTAWLLFGLHRIIVWELPFLGMSVVVVRVVSSLFFPFVAGIFAQFLWNKFNL